jgi:hypothetical protein
MWEPRRLTTLWVFTACYRDSLAFTFFCLLHQRHSTHVLENVSIIIGPLPFSPQATILTSRVTCLNSGQIFITSCIRNRSNSLYTSTPGMRFSLVLSLGFHSRRSAKNVKCSWHVCHRVGYIRHVVCCSSEILRHFLL